MASPYSVSLKIQYPSGTNLNNVNVTVRIESTNESATKITNSSGEVLFNLGQSSDFPSGWQVNDIFSYVVLYQGFEAYGSHTIASGEGSFTSTIVLTAIITAPSLRYFTVQEFLDYFNMKIIEDDAENGIKSQQIIKIGQMVEKSIDSDTNVVFDNNSGSYYPQTDLIDTNKNLSSYWTTKLPVRTVTNLYTTQNDQETTPDYDNNTTEWDSLTEGTDFVIDKGNDGIGRIHIVNSSFQPISRRWGLRIVYTYGRTSVPIDIKMLAIAETGIRMLGATFIKDRIKKLSDIEIPDLSHFADFKRKILGKYMANGIGNLNDLPDLT